MQAVILMMLSCNVCRNLKHPHIVSLLAYCVNNENLILVMNYVDGSNLDTLIFSKNRACEVITCHKQCIIVVCS